MKRLDDLEHERRPAKMLRRAGITRQASRGLNRLLDDSGAGREMFKVALVDPAGDRAR